MTPHVKITPIAPTKQMLDAGMAACEGRVFPQDNVHGPRAMLSCQFAAMVKAAPEVCSCGDRLKSECPGEWEPGCDLGANAECARTVPSTVSDADLAAADSLCKSDDKETIARLNAEVARLQDIINTPQADDFLRAVSIEAEHQRQRWPDGHDSSKTPADWFWLVGYLAGKALHAQTDGDRNKAEHHIITTAAALGNWHRSLGSLVKA